MSLPLNILTSLGIINAPKESTVMIDLFKGLYPKGINNKGLYLFTGEESVGKSCLILQSALNVTFNSLAPIRVGIVSLKLNYEDWMNRFLININKLNFDNVNEETNELKNQHYIMEIFSNINLIHGYSISISQIKSTLTKWVNEENIALVYIDSFEMIENEHYKGIASKTNHNAKVLKDLSTELSIPICVTYQTKDIELHSAFAQHFDVITSIKRPEYFEECRGETLLQIVKNNFRSLNKIKLYFNLSEQKITNTLS